MTTQEELEGIQKDLEDVLTRVQTLRREFDREAGVELAKKKRKSKSKPKLEVPTDTPDEPGYVAQTQDLPSEILTEAVIEEPNPYPTHSELAQFKLWANQITRKLSLAGMKSAGEKMRDYVLSEARVDEVEKITKFQWREIQGKIDPLSMDFRIDDLVAEVGRTA